MKIAARLSILLTLCLSPLSFAQPAPQLDTSKIDAALGRPGSWTEGVYVVSFPRPDLGVMLQGVQLSTIHVVSFVTFTGTEEHSEVMGEICAVPEEVTPSITKLRAGGLEITAAHNHFLGESPRLMFIHFMAHGRASELARTFRDALAATSTPLGKSDSPLAKTEPGWAKFLKKQFGGQANYCGDCRAEALEVDVFRADFPSSPRDFWYQSSLFFQPASDGNIVGTGDIAVTATELNRVLTILARHDFRIMGVHNHMIDEQPRLFFVHYWKISTSEDLADGLKAVLAATRARER